MARPIIRTREPSYEVDLCPGAVLRTSHITGSFPAGRQVGVPIANDPRVLLQRLADALRTASALPTFLGSREKAEPVRGRLARSSSTVGVPSLLPVVYEKKVCGRPWLANSWKARTSKRWASL